MTFKLIKCCLEIYLTMSHFLHISNPDLFANKPAHWNSL